LDHCQKSTTPRKRNKVAPITALLPPVLVYNKLHQADDSANKARRGNPMLSQFEIGHIKAAFSLAEEGKLPPRAKQKFEYCRKLIALAEEQDRAKHMRSYAAAIGTKPSQGLMDSIAADCAIHGCD
jgi:hypothetical protein